MNSATKAQRDDSTNSARVLTKIIRDIADRRKIAVDSMSDDWILALRSGGQTRRIFGYDFELNSCTAQLIAKDKSATSDSLERAGLPHIEHALFHHPDMRNYVPMAGNWPAMSAYAEKHQFDIVCKPNTGTGGSDVYRVGNQIELEEVVNRLFSKHRAIALSPFVDIHREYRLILLDGHCELAYYKTRPSICGDGTQTIADLLASANLETPDDFWKRHRRHDVLPAGQRLYVNWRHNLGQGSCPQILKGAEIAPELLHLAVQSAEAIGLRVGAVDIVEAAGQLRVLEINSGIMMERLARLAPDGMNIARRIYDKIICAMFGWEQS